MTPFRCVFAVIALLGAGSATAAALSVVKAMTTVSDPQGNLLPRAIPGAEVDYTVTVLNPSGNLLTSVARVSLTDAIPARTALRISDLGLAGSGPFEFLDGSLLGTGLLSSGLTVTFRGLASETDDVDFSSNNGASWTYHPVDRGGGYDASVTNIRVRPAGNQAAGSTFRLRFRIKML